MLFHTLSTILCLSALISATPVTVEHEASGNSASIVPVVAPDLDSTTYGNATNYSFDAAQIHENVMANLSPDRITTTDKLEEFLAANAAKILEEDDKAIYLKDKQTWMLVAEHHDANSVEKRQQCYATLTRGIIKTKGYWAPWHAVSSCVKSGANPAGGSITLTTEEGFSYTADGGVSLGGWEGALGASIGFSITYSYSEAVSVACNVAGGDTVQIWRRHQHGWAWVKDQTCTFCNGGQSCKDRQGWVNAPAASSQTDRHQWGCSAKSRSYLKGC